VVAYEPNLADLFRRCGDYVGKILHGAKPSDLTIQRPQRFDLVTNLKILDALGLSVPPVRLATADEVIGWGRRLPVTVRVCPLARKYFGAGAAAPLCPYRCKLFVAVWMQLAGPGVLGPVHDHIALAALCDAVASMATLALLELTRPVGFPSLNRTRNVCAIYSPEFNTKSKSAFRYLPSLLGSRASCGLWPAHGSPGLLGSSLK
jgi:hypothetical protein